MGRNGRGVPAGAHPEAVTAASSSLKKTEDRGGSKREKSAGSLALRRRPGKNCNGAKYPFLCSEKKGKNIGSERVKVVRPACEKTLGRGGSKTTLGGGGGSKESTPRA